MQVELALFGAFRQFDPAARIELELTDDARVADLRQAFADYAARHWPGFQPGLLARSAFASEREVLRESEPIPADRHMAVLPPVSGG